jgi:hypothetical protein
MRRGLGLLLALALSPAGAWTPAVVTPARIVAPALAPRATAALPRAAARRTAGIVNLKASSPSSLAADPEAAWTQHGTGDSSLLSGIAASLQVLKPEAQPSKHVAAGGAGKGEGGRLVAGARARGQPG